MNTRRSSPQLHVNPNGVTRPAMTEVMDVLPWPKGYDFAGGESWWRRVLSQSDRERLDNLIGLALLDSKLCERLVVNRDRSLMSSFGLSEQAQEWLVNIKASTLKDFAQAIVASSHSAYDVASEAA